MILNSHKNPQIKAVVETLALSSLLLLLSAIFANQAFAQGGGPTGSFVTPEFDETLIRNSVGNLFKLIEGAFGALIMVVAGLGAIVAASMGAYRASVGMLVVALGAFILRALVSLFFGTDFVDFEAT
jgi:hypothetical protein